MNRLTERILIIADDYARFTGKEGSWKSRMSISEYAELRRQAVWEEQEGVSYDDMSGSVPVKKPEEVPVQYKKNIPIEETSPNISSESYSKVGSEPEQSSKSVFFKAVERTVADLDAETQLLLSIEEG